jgi:hypothetical protein
LTLVIVIVIAIDVSFAIIVIVDMIKIVIGIINVIVRKCVLRDWVMVGAVRNGCEVDSYCPLSTMSAQRLGVAAIVRVLGS